MNKTTCMSALLTMAMLSFTASAEVANHRFFQSPQAATIDGKLTEDVWSQATSYLLPYNTNPGDNSPAPVKTEVKLYGTENSLFVAFVAHDPNPEQIRAYYRDRDTIFQDDFVGVVIDTFNDERRAYEFFVNAMGVQGDLIKDETRGGKEDENWDAIWDSAAQISEIGYTVEMEIPYTALRFPAGEKELTWGIDAMRIYPRDSRMVLAASMFDRAIDCHLCQIHKLQGLKNLKQGNNFQLTPTLTTIRTDARDTINDEEEPTLLDEWSEGDIDPEFGMDLRWGINQGLVLNATINPDFSQVEADSAQLDINNTFSLFFPEKRPFFLDGKDYFDTSEMNLVHTRNIAAPDVGLKITGKKGQHTYGGLVANDQSTSFLIPGNLGSDIASVTRIDEEEQEFDVKSKIAIARYRKDIGERSNIGALVTSRDADNYNNTVVAVDGIHQFNKANRFTYQAAYSETRNPQSLVEEFAAEEGEVDFFNVLAEQSGMAYSLGYRHSQRNYSIRASYDNFDDEFRGDLGFIRKVGFERVVIGGNYEWDGSPESKWTKWGVNGDWDKTWDQSGNVLEEEAEAYFWIEGPMQLVIEPGILQRDRYWQWSETDVDGNDYLLDDLFKEKRLSLFVRFNPLPNLRVWSWMTKGDQVDFSNGRLGQASNFEVGGNWKIGKHFSSEIEYDYSDLDVEGGELFNAAQVDARFNIQFDLKSYLRLVVQYTNIERDVLLYRDDDVDSNNKYLSTQLIYAYKFNPQTLFYLGYSDGGFQDDHLDKINKDNRSIFMKMSYAWQL
jgi:hypothetical protein